MYKQTRLQVKNIGKLLHNKKSPPPGRRRKSILMHRGDVACKLPFDRYTVHAHKLCYKRLAKQKSRQ